MPQARISKEELLRRYQIEIRVWVIRIHRDVRIGARARVLPRRYEMGGAKNHRPCAPHNVKRQQSGHGYARADGSALEELFDRVLFLRLQAIVFLRLAGALLCSSTSPRESPGTSPKLTNCKSVKKLLAYLAAYCRAWSAPKRGSKGKIWTLELLNIARSGL